MDALADRLKSRETVYLGHSVKRASQKAVAALQLAQGEKADKAAKITASNAAIRDLGLYGLEIDKAELVASSCKQQLVDYEVLEKQVCAMVESTQADIETLTADLRVAKKERSHKEQYEALAKLVNKHSSKPKSRAEQAKIELELQKLGGEKEKLEEQIKIRGKQFAVLMATIDDLTRTLVEDPLLEGETEASSLPDAVPGRRARNDIEEGEEEEDETSKRPKLA